MYILPCIRISVASYNASYRPAHRTLTMIDRGWFYWGRDVFVWTTGILPASRATNRPPTLFECCDTNCARDEKNGEKMAWPHRLCMDTIASRLHSWSSTTASAINHLSHQCAVDWALVKTSSSAGDFRTMDFNIIPRLSARARHAVSLYQLKCSLRVRNVYTMFRTHFRMDACYWA